MWFLGYQEPELWLNTWTDMFCFAGAEMGKVFILIVSYTTQQKICGPSILGWHGNNPKLYLNYRTSYIQNLISQIIYLNLCSHHILVPLMRFWLLQTKRRSIKCHHWKHNFCGWRDRRKNDGIYKHGTYRFNGNGSCKVSWPA